MVILNPKIYCFKHLTRVSFSVLLLERACVGEHLSIFLNSKEMDPIHSKIIHRGDIVGYNGREAKKSHQKLSLRILSITMQGRLEQ